MKKCLIVVDYQVDFVTGSLGFPGAERLDSVICEKITKAQKDGGDVVYTLDTHGADYMGTQEGRLLPIPHCKRESAGWRLYGRTAELLKDARAFEKPAFGCLSLIPFLQQGQYDTVELCGLVSNICILSNAVLAKAALPEAEVVVDAAATACADPVQNEEALRALEGVQVKVLRN